MKEKIIKIVYFDENSTIDYINIVDGWKTEKETTASKKIESVRKYKYGIILYIKGDEFLWNVL